MSEATLLPRPDREPDFTDFDNPACKLEFWWPREELDGVGHERYTITGNSLEQVSEIADKTVPGVLDYLAEAGMRDAFTENGLTIKSLTFTSRERPGVVVRELDLAYSSVYAMAQQARRRAATTNGERYTFLPTTTEPGPELRISAAGTKQLMVVGEHSEDQPTQSPYWLDRATRIPAWLCLPPRITAGLCDGAQTMDRRNGEAWRLPPEEEEATRAALRHEMAKIIDAIDIHAIKAIHKGENDVPLLKILGVMLGAEESEVKTAILDHIKRHEPRDILVATLD